MKFLFRFTEIVIPQAAVTPTINYPILFLKYSSAFAIQSQGRRRNSSYYFSYILKRQK